jgi:AraC family transcriptional regulator
MNSEYQIRLNRVMDYIDRHLEDPIDLDTLASVAAFSKYHFHRIFSTAIGESLGAYILRLRLENAAGVIASNKNKGITEIAYDYGFSSPAVFSRAFKECFGVSPSTWRSCACKPDSKNCKQEDKESEMQGNRCKVSCLHPSYSTSIKPLWRIQMERNEKTVQYSVTVQDIVEKTVAYVRHTGPYAGDEELFGMLFGKIMKWGNARDLFIPGKTELITIYHDSPDITDEDKLRISVCITVPKDTEPSGEVGVMDIPAGKYAIAEMLIDVEQYADAWNSFCGVWLPESGYQFADGPCYELSLNDPEEHPEHKHHIAIYLPVKPL